MHTPQWLARVFVSGVPIQPVPGKTRATAPPTTKSQGTFLTIQSLACFGGGTVAVTALVTACEQVLGWKGPAVVYITALVVGAIIWLITIGEPSAKPGTLREWIISGFIAFVNALVLAQAVVGVRFQMSM